MTTPVLPNDDRYIDLSPAAGSTALDYDFELKSEDGLTVVRTRAGVKATLVNGTDYDFLTGLGDATGGTITLLAASLAGDRYQLIGLEPIERATDLSDSHAFSASRYNEDGDLLTIFDQEQRRDIARAMKSDYGQAGLTIDTSVVTAGKTLMRGTGDDIVAGPDADQIDAAQGYAEAAEAARDISVTASETSVAARDIAVAAATSVTAPLELLALVDVDTPALDPDYYEITYYDTNRIMGSGGLYRKVVSEPAHDGKRQNGNGTWYELQIHIARPEKFGALGDDDADDGPAIVKAAAYCAAKSAVLRMGRRTYKSSVTIDLSLVQHTICDSTILKPTMDAGIAIKYSAASGELIQKNKLLGDIWVLWPAVDYTKERWSFFLQNVYQGEFHISSFNATISLFMYGVASGCVSNDLYLGFMWGHNIGIYITSSSSAGWVNMNRFHGGIFSGYVESFAGALYESTASHIYITDTPYPNNGNEFLNPSLEWIGPGFKLARMDGFKNCIRPGYMEMNWPADTAATGSWITDVGEQDCIDVSCVPYADGYDPLLGSASRIDVSGATNPTVLGKLGYMDMGALGCQYLRNASDTRAPQHLTNTAAGPALRLQNSASASNPGLIIEKADGSIGVSIPAAAPWTVFNGTRKITWGVSGEPASGTWEVGDLSFNTTPVTAGWVGYVCTVAGTPGTWKGFGAIGS